MAHDQPANEDASAPSFEQSLAQLEKIVESLEEGNLSLADSLTCYEKGIGTLRRCYEFLEQAEGRIEVLATFDEKGRPLTTPFDEASPAQKEKAASPPTRRRTSGRKARKPKATASSADSTPEKGDIDATETLF